MAHCLNTLPSDALHGFFQECLKRIRSMELQEADQAAEILRRRLGMWYSTGLTTVLNVSGGGTEETIGKRMNALAVEALRWVDSSFLAHVVLWSRELALHQSGVEEILMSTAVALPGGDMDVEDVCRRYDDGLRSYVGEHGSTVRRDVHLQQVGRHIGNEAYPSLRSDGRIPRLTGAGQPITLCLPSEPDKLGSDKEWRALLEKELSSCGTAFEFLQLAAGSDSWYADSATRIGAVAHLYIVSPEKKQFAREYVETMREHLNRLALDYSTTVIRELRELAIKNADFHQSLNIMLTRETQELDRALQQVESQSRRLRVLVATDMWSILVQWIREVRPLFKTGAPVGVCGCTILGNHGGHWTDLHYLAALLMLAGESAGPDAPGIRTEIEARDNDYKEQATAYLTQRWSEYVGRATAERLATMTQIHRCLARLGIFSYHPGVADGPKGTEFLHHLVWKDAFTEKLEEIQQSPSTLTIAYCMGARYDHEYPQNAPTSHEDVVSVVSPLRIGVVASGLCKLLEALCENSVGLETPLTVRMDASEENRWRVRVSPVSVTESESSREVSLISDEGLAKLFRTAGSFAAKDTFPWTSTSEWQRETTQAVFRAMGQDGSSWVQTTRTFHDTPTHQEIQVLGENRQIIARMYTQQNSESTEVWVEFAKQPK